MGKFSIQWVNDPTDHQRTMTRHTVMLRRGHTTHHGIAGMTCRELYLDQVYIVFRPTSQITAGEFVAPDANDMNWHAETDQLLVNTDPGFKFPLYSVGGDTEDHIHTAHHPVTVSSYSAALAVTPTSEDPAEGYWCRTYRPIRDQPVAIHLKDVSQLDIELLFPLLLDNSVNPTLRQVPNYRILRVLCEFSTVDD